MDRTTIDQLKSQACPGSFTTYAQIASVAAAASGMTYHEAVRLIIGHPAIVGEDVRMNELLTQRSALSLFDWLTNQKKDK